MEQAKGRAIGGTFHAFWTIRQPTCSSSVQLWCNRDVLKAPHSTNSRTGERENEAIFRLSGIHDPNVE
jgi:hypothetical protein